MSRIIDFNARGDQCRAIAEWSLEPLIKQSYLIAAACWEELAAIEARKTIGWGDLPEFEVSTASETG